MGLNVTGGDLNFKATIDTQHLENQVRQMSSRINTLVQNLQKSTTSNNNLSGSLAKSQLVARAADKAFDFFIRIYQRSPRPGSRCDKV